MFCLLITVTYLFDWLTHILYYAMAFSGYSSDKTLGKALRLFKAQIKKHLLVNENGKTRLLKAKEKSSSKKVIRAVGQRFNPLSGLERMLSSREFAVIFGALGCCSRGVLKPGLKSMGFDGQMGQKWMSLEPDQYYGFMSTRFLGHKHIIYM